MKTLSQYFSKKKENAETIFIPYIMAGANGMDRLLDEMQMLIDSGVSAIELGIPFSDPVADGPVIQKAGLAALAQGTTLKKVVHFLQQHSFDVPIILMGYFNSFYHYGLDSLVKDLALTDVKGLIIPDLPFEHRELVAQFIDETDLALIQLVTLTSEKDRICQLATASEGFVYAVAVNGTTGVEKEYKTGLDHHLDKICAVSPLPVFVGFGISKPEHVQRFTQHCDGVIVGSKIVQLLAEEPLEQVGRYVTQMITAET